MPLTPERMQDAYRQMLVIRKFEEMIRSLYQQGKIRGSFHPCVGQEATAVGGCWAIRSNDYMTCTYRGHGQALAKGMSVNAAMAEMLGRVGGCSKGKGGSMHFTDPSVGLLGANAIVAGGVPHAAGAALAARPGREFPREIPSNTPVDRRAAELVARPLPFLRPECGSLRRHACRGRG